MNLWTRPQDPPRARRSDPVTSKVAADNADSDTKAGRIVLSVLADGKARTDEEIYDAYRSDGIEREGGGFYSAQRLRCGRKRLSDIGSILDTGETRPTRNGGKSRVWRIPTTNGA